MTPALEYHKQLKGKIEVISRAQIQNRADLALAYTPGVAEPCKAIAEDVSKVYDYTRKGNMVAVITDGSAVLGLGNIGAEASLPVMEGKCVLFKQFAGVDAFPIAIRTQNVDEFVRTVENISPMFGGINLEDISAPRCFEIEERLKASLDIPVFHDDQHGTAIISLAGLYNALKVVKKEIQDIRIVVSGVGAAGVAIAKLLHLAGVRYATFVDSKGIIFAGREYLNAEKESLLKLYPNHAKGTTLGEALVGADMFVGVSGAANSVTQEMIVSMAENPIIFAQSNPSPEVLPEVALAAGAGVVATGRSDFPNQLNNALVFPGIFKGALEARVRHITDEMKLAVARALADLVEQPTAEYIIPDTFDERVVRAVVEAIKLSHT
jgi:malate dehydrogenase (oxaloacetate-decarboxylating)